MKGYFLFSALVIFVLLSACQGRPEHQQAKISNGVVVVDVSGLEDSKPEFFTVKFGRKRVDFFVLRIGDSVESYLDACMRCYVHKKGFRVDGFYLVCRYCNERYPLDQLKKGIASCYPIPLKGKLEGNLYKIEADLLKRAVKFF